MMKLNDRKIITWICSANSESQIKIPEVTGAEQSFSTRRINSEYIAKSLPQLLKGVFRLRIWFIYCVTLFPLEALNVLSRLIF